MDEERSIFFNDIESRLDGISGMISSTEDGETPRAAASLHMRETIGPAVEHLARLLAGAQPDGADSARRRVGKMSDAWPAGGRPPVMSG